MGFDALQSVRSSPMVRMNLPPPSSGCKSKPSSSARYSLDFFVPEDRGSTFRRSVGQLVPDYTPSNPRRCNLQHDFVNDKAKGKVVHLFTLVPRNEDVKSAGGMAPRTVNFGTKWRERCLFQLCRRFQWKRFP